MQRKIKYSVLSVLLLLGACAGTPKNADDPFERVNREIYGFNRTIDRAVFKPTAYLYKNYIPSPVRTGVGNFFSNLEEITTVANDVLQGKLNYAAHDLARFGVNSTIGLLGFFDVAGELGLDRRKEDFGQTLYVWGYEQSAYLILPFLGPSTIRDGIGRGVDLGLSIWPWLPSDDAALGLLALNLVDKRAAILHKESILTTIALDEYTLIRDAFLQRRTFLSTDGTSDFSEEEEDPLDELEDY
tara:strand:+ start:70028 stop:70756 length:729 start_codon:yes stop_codon:yes gene_type:complete